VRATLLQELERIRGLVDAPTRAQAAQALIDALGEVEPELVSLRRDAVTELRSGEPQWSHQQVADLLDLHRNRAQQIARGLSGGHAQRAVQRASEEH
jgi:hypothetical protein